MTSLERELAASSPPRRVPSLEETAELVSRNFGRVFEAQTLWLESLDSLLSTPQDTPMRAPEDLRRIAGEEDIYMA